MLRSLLAFSVLLWILVSPPGLRAQLAADHVAMGQAATEAHDLPTGLAHFEAALELDSSSYEANWRAAIALLDLGEQIPDEVKSPERDSLYARAESLSRRAVAADSAGAEGYFALAAAMGRASLTKGKKERIRRATAIRDAALRTTELDPSHDGAYHILGRWNAEIMRLSGLSRFFARQFLGAGIFSQASWSQAIANMEKAVELDTARIYHRLALAEIYAHRKQFDEARSQLARVKTLPPREILDSAYKRKGAELAEKIADER